MGCRITRAAIVLVTALAFVFASRASLAAPDATAWRSYEKGDYARAAKLYAEEARKGDRLAQFNYAMMLFRGETTETERGEALRWLRRAADAGVPRAWCDPAG